MSRRPDRMREPGTLDEVVTFAIIAAIVIVPLGAMWAAVEIGSQLDHVNAGLSRNPVTLVFELIERKVVWPPAATWILVLIAAVVVVLVVLIARAVVARGRNRTRVDAAAKHMGGGKDLAALTAKGARATAKRLGVEGWIGIVVGRTVRGGVLLHGSVEDMLIAIFGPRMGKTTSLVIPAINEAPGAVLTTSNKRDVVDATRDIRAKAGHVWVFDPQAIALEQPTWWWNPLSYITDDVKAAKLAEHFASASRAGDARADAFFDPAGQDLLAGLLLAAALDNLPITQVFTWVTRPTDDTAMRILERHGYAQMADAVAGVVNSTDKLRSSVFSTAQQMASCLKNQQVIPWVTPSGAGGYDRRPEFDPHDFVRSTDTLYSLSKEGKGTAGPLVTALTAATVEAAEEWATYQAGGRLAVPLLGILDEAANVCRWQQLPDLYSHYGSRGIILMTILQSYSQGVDVWGREGMRKLWSAANVKVYGGGVAETDFLSDVSQLVGEHDKSTTSVNVGQGIRSTSQQLRRERTLDVSELAALPRGRAVVFASGAPATLVETIPWTKGPRAAEVQASIAAHQPSAVNYRRPTLTRAGSTPSPSVDESQEVI
jgi:type IV secretory pathway TraG/TraD family ATPase VirD4